MVPKRILVVEDDADDQLLFCEAVQNLYENLKCDVAVNGIEALEYLLNPPPYDMIFLDLNMPIMNGLETLERVKNDESIKHIPVVIVTTSTHVSDMKKTKELGAISYFSKPAIFADYVAGLKAIITEA